MQSLEVIALCNTTFVKFSGNKKRPSPSSRHINVRPLKERKFSESDFQYIIPRRIEDTQEKTVESGEFRRAEIISKATKEASRIGEKGNFGKEKKNIFKSSQRKVVINISGPNEPGGCLKKVLTKTTINHGSE